ncbi:MAG: flavodoxin [Oscillibacter sp.]|nr:flavodoxin [Oscillibacter sp.]
MLFQRTALVAYFSASGTTAAAARTLAEAAGASLYEIKPQTPYSPADLDWTDRKSRSSVEMNDRTFRPPLADRDAHVEDCGTIFLDFPIWWYTAPTIVSTFLESYDFSGKTIVLFATSGGSGLGRTAADLRSSAPGAVIREGKLLNGRQTKEALAAWVESFGV